jgi:hypothetical protein
MAMSITAQANESFPTVDRVDHVLTCMMAHGGQMIENLNSCSCEMDFLMTKLTYEEFVDAKTVESFRNTPGDKGAVFRDSEMGRNAYGKYDEARDEAKKQCFMVGKTVRKAKVGKTDGDKTDGAKADAASH